MSNRNDIIHFLARYSDKLTSRPVDGCVHSIYHLFISSENESRSTLSFKEFENELRFVSKMDKFSILWKNPNTIEFLNPLNLNIMLEYNSHANCTKSQPKQNQRKKKAKSPRLSLDSLMDLLEPTQAQSDTYDYQYLDQLLKYETACQKLSKSRIANTTPMIPFVPTCNDQNHSATLSKQLQNKQHVKIQKDLQSCLESKIHYIPMIKQHTDASLGDCSYLDTCHNLDSCRYVHYVKNMPHQEYQKRITEADEFNSKISYFEKINPWDRNGSVSNMTRNVLERQWINCDILKFNFKILGKFAAVIADPPWNIHMNLPYGTCNDTELLNLPLNDIQDEGIIFLWVTGRVIEIGKESLRKWGYDIRNELIWIKSNQLSRTICTGRTGHWLNHSKEHLIVGVKGNPEWLDKQVDVDYIVSQTRETSRKPDELYGMIERLVGPHARKLEIFGKDHNTRPGWFSEYISIFFFLQLND